MKILIILFFALSAWSETLVETQVEKDTNFLASDKLKGRTTGTPENLEVQNWLIERLTAKKVRPAGSSDLTNFRYPFQNSYDFKNNQKISGTNIMGIIYPKNIWTDEKPKVMIGAHYDHTNVCIKRFGSVDEICNGATDNATSVAILLDLIEYLPNVIQAPIVFAFWDAEEQGLLGSDAYLKSPSIDLTQLNAYVNLDIVGLNLYRGLENNHFVIGSETGGAKLVDLVKMATTESGAGVEYHRLSYAYGHGRSDMSTFVRQKYNIPVVFFTDGDGAIYHSSSDNIENVNFKKVKSVAAVLKTMLEQLSKMNRGELEYIAPKVLIDKGSLIQNILTLLLGNKNVLKYGLPMPVFSDVFVIDRLYETLLANKESNQFSADTIAKLIESQAKLKEIQTKGERSFSTVDKYNLLKAVALYTLFSKSLSSAP